MTFATLALICGVALVGPLLAVNPWARVPVVIGELGVGVLLGASGLGLVPAADHTLTFLAEVGFALVMVLAGAHVPLRSAGLRSGVRAGLLRAALVGVLAVPAGLGLAALFGTGHGLLYAVLLASSSAALVMPSLAGVPLTGEAVLALLAQVAIADAACIVALPLALEPAAAPRRALGALAVLVAALLWYLVLAWAERTGRRRALHELSETRGLALELRISLTVLFGLAALATVLHVSVMLAGFGVGLALAGIGEPRRLAKQLFAVTEGFFGPLFFLWLGASLDLRALASSPHLVVLGIVLGLAAVAVHGLVALIGQPLPLAVASAAQLGVPVAAAALGRQLGVLLPGEDAALLLGALVTVGAVIAVSGRVAAVARSTASAAPPDTPAPPDAPAAGPTAVA